MQRRRLSEICRRMQLRRAGHLAWGSNRGVEARVIGQGMIQNLASFTGLALLHLLSFFGFDI
jgi:hypothetical protein